MGNCVDTRCSMFCGVLFGISLFILMAISIGFGTMANYSKEQCHISQVITATHVPTHNNTENWVECRVGSTRGSGSWTSWTPCIQIHLDIL